MDYTVRVIGICCPGIEERIGERERKDRERMEAGERRTADESGP